MKPRSHLHRCPHCEKDWQHAGDCALGTEYGCDLCLAERYFDSLRDSDARIALIPPAGWPHGRPSPNELTLMRALKLRTLPELERVLNQPEDPKEVYDPASQLEEFGPEYLAYWESQNEDRLTEISERLRTEAEEQVARVCVSSLRLLCEKVARPLAQKLGLDTDDQLELYEKEVSRRNLWKLFRARIGELEDSALVEMTQQLHTLVSRGRPSEVLEIRRTELRSVQGELERRGIRKDLWAWPIEFAVSLSELGNVLKYFFALKVPKKQARTQFADIYGSNFDVEFKTAGTAVKFRAHAIRVGYARVPYIAMEWLRQAVRSIKQETVRVQIKPGHLRVGSLRFSNPEITLRQIGARIADLPMNAALPGVLALLVQYDPEELEDSGLLKMVLAAQEKVSEIMDRALEALKPLEIGRRALDEMIWQEIRKRA